MIFWLNGEFSTKPHAIDIADRGFLLGDGVFETILVVKGIPAFFDAHLNRLRASMTALRLHAEIDESFLGVVLELVRRNSLDQGMAAVRLTLSRGTGARGLLISANTPPTPTLLATVSKFHASSDPSPLRLAVSSYTRSEASLSSRHKTLNYIDNVMARDEAAAKKCDDAVMLNNAGRVACVSAGNIFEIVSDSAAVTPALGEGALGGIVRGILLGGAGSGMVIEEGAIERNALSSGGLFITNSLLGVRPAFIMGANALLPALASKSLRILQSWYEDVLNEDLKRRADQI